MVLAVGQDEMVWTLWMDTATLVTVYSVKLDTDAYSHLSHFGLLFGQFRCRMIFFLFEMYFFCMLMPRYQMEQSG